MRIAQNYVWLYWTLQCSNAFDIPLSLEPVKGDAASRKVMVPWNTKRTVITNDQYFLTLGGHDAMYFQKLASGTKIREIYVYKSFNPVSLAKALNVKESRVVIIKWHKAQIQPIMQITTQKNVPKNRYINFFDVEKRTKYVGPINVDVVVDRVSNHNANREGVVYFYFSHVHSHFPEWAYDRFMDAFEEAGGDRSIESIDCDQIAKLKLPEFLFELDDVYFFELSKANYFMRNSDDKCYLAVRLSQSGQWIIGAALTKTYKAVFLKSSGSKVFQIGFI